MKPDEFWHTLKNSFLLDEGWRPMINRFTIASPPKIEISKIAHHSPLASSASVNFSTAPAAAAKIAKLKQNFNIL